MNNDPFDIERRADIMMALKAIYEGGEAGRARGAAVLAIYGLDEVTCQPFISRYGKPYKRPERFGKVVSGRTRHPRRGA
jgi:hypothetical protein